MLVGFPAAISFAALFAGNYVADFLSRGAYPTRRRFVGGVALILIGLKQIV